MPTMDYDPITLPFDRPLTQLSPPEVRRYGEWFHEARPARLQMLTRAIRSTPGFGDWQPDRSPASLDTLGSWFAGEVTLMPRSDEELRKLEGELSFPIEIPAETLTYGTLSLAMDVGMYLAEVVTANVPDAAWDQRTRNKRFVDYGQPVLIGFAPVPMNPVGLVIVLAHGISKGTRSGEGLREPYEIWVSWPT